MNKMHYMYLTHKKTLKIHGITCNIKKIVSVMQYCIVKQIFKMLKRNSN